MEAEDILRFALYKEVLKRQRRKKRKLNHGKAVEGDEEGSGDETAAEDDEDDEETQPTRMEQQEKGKTKDIPQAQQDPVWGDGSQDVEMAPAADQTPFTDGVVSPERHTLFRSRLAHLFANQLQDVDQLELVILLPQVNEGLDTASLFGTAEASQVLLAMTESNELFYSGGIVYKM